MLIPPCLPGHACASLLTRIQHVAVCLPTGVTFCHSPSVNSGDTCACSTLGKEHIISPLWEESPSGLVGRQGCRFRSTNHAGTTRWTNAQRNRNAIETEPPSEQSHGADADVRTSFLTLFRPKLRHSSRRNVAGNGKRIEARGRHHGHPGKRQDRLRQCAESASCASFSLSPGAPGKRARVLEF